MARLQARTRKVDGFIVRGDELAAETPTVFKDDPVRLIRVFRHCQQLECSLDFHLAQLIKESLPLMNIISWNADAGPGLPGHPVGGRGGVSRSPADA
jgi:UTP:GlnB (protein PII) uridylyltransferase